MKQLIPLIFIIGAISAVPCLTNKELNRTTFEDVKEAFLISPNNSRAIFSGTNHMGFITLIEWLVDKFDEYFDKRYDKNTNVDGEICYTLNKKNPYCWSPYSLDCVPDRRII